MLHHKIVLTLDLDVLARILQGELDKFPQMA
jgi:hypothetical protein